MLLGAIGFKLHQPTLETESLNLNTVTQSWGESLEVWRECRVGVYDSLKVLEFKIQRQKTRR